MDTSISGFIVGTLERAYDSFTNNNGEVVPGGKTRRVIVVGSSMKERPSELHVRSDEASVKMFDALRALEVPRRFVFDVDYYDGGQSGNSRMTLLGVRDEGK